MKNEIGRKITSLTIMAIMFAGGMTIAAPSLMPEAIADFSSTDGALTVSSTYIQGGAVLEVVVNDPDYSDTTVDINGGPSVDFNGTSYDLSQGVNGKWYGYFVDASIAALILTGANGIEYGTLCQSGLGVAESTTTLIVANDIDVYAAAGASMGTGTVQTDTDFAGGCLDIDGMLETLDDTSTTITREDLTAVVVQGAPALSNHDDKAMGATGIDMGQRGHGLNASGYGSWPFIFAFELEDSNTIGYGSDTATVAFGNTDAQTSISLANQSPAGNTQIHLSVTDPALNIDPTTADIWIFELSDADDRNSVILANNGTNSVFTLAELGEMQFAENGQVSADAEGVLDGNKGTVDLFTMTESGANTGVFESWHVNGTSQLNTVDQATGDTVTIFSYGGNSLDMIITYHDASITMDAGGDWLPTTAVTVTVTDPDQNRDPSTAETLSITDPLAVIPTIKIGNPKTLATGSNPCIALNNTYGNPNVGTYTTLGCNANPASVVLNSELINSGVSVGGQAGDWSYGVAGMNVTDNSERLRIIVNGTTATGGISQDSQGVTWVNVTTGHTRASLVDLAGTVVLNYDVTSVSDLLSSSAINVLITDSGNNRTNWSESAIGVQTSGNVKAGVVDLDDEVEFLRNTDVSAIQTWSADPDGTDASAGSNFVTVNFKFTHAVSAFLENDADFTIAADFCNFDQDNGTLTHNCIYRIEAEETGADTGVFEGTVEYVMLNNSSNTNSATHAGAHQGNDQEVEGLLTTSGSAVTVVLMDSTSGSDSVRVVYNDTDAFQTSGGTKIGAQLETVTHTGIPDLDADKYGVGDVATITITDPDLNQDSSIRDVYKNSSTTFQITVTPAGATSGDANEAQQFVEAGQTIIETGPSTGVFVGTFTVPNKLGGDMELTYTESKNAGGSALSYYDTAEIQSNSGSVSLDRSVYPVPFAQGDLTDGAGTAGGVSGASQNETGTVVVWITVSDADEINDTLTTAAGTSAGSILLKVGTTTCFTAGSTVSAAAGTDPAELGPLSETSIGSQTYETSASFDKPTDCGSNVTIASGDVLQVHYEDGSDDSGSSATFFDSATFDLRTGSLSVDKDVYVMGSDMVITITDPDLNLDSATAESYDMGIIEWDSAADSSELLRNSAFSHNPSSLEETGTDTGVFQTVTTLPTTEVSSGNAPAFGEKVTLTYVDQGLSGENNVADDSLDIETYFNISNFGALIELDKAVYNWTDTVYITVTAPDHNNNTAAEETIGTAALPLQASTRQETMCTASSTTKFFVGAETGVDTGVFTSEIALTGYSLAAHNNPQSPADSKTCSQTDSTGNDIRTKGQTDGISVSYEYTDGVVVVASASVMFNIAEASFDSSSASAGGSAVFTVVDPDENTNGDVIQSFNADVYSDSDNGGLTLTMTETDEDTGVFEATVFFTSDAATSGTNLRVSEGDTVTAEYTEKTLPEPYADTDTLTVASTLTIGTAFPPLERAPAANARVVDAFGASVAEVTVDQQVQIAADVSNGQSSDQAFAYLVQVQDSDGVTVSLAWITGSLTATQSMSPALSWTPSASGSYTATVFVWESVDNPTALSPTTSVSIDVV